MIGLITAALPVIGQLLDDVIETDAEKAAAKAKLMKLAQDGQLKDMETRLSAILAEAQSSDPWTSRARPSFMYVIYILILSSIPMGFLFAFQPETADAVIQGFTGWLNAIPDSLYTLFGAGYLGLNPPGFAAGTVALAFGLAAASIFPALMMGIFSTRITREGAVAGMVVGLGVTLFYVFQHKGVMFVSDWRFLPGLGTNWFFGIEPNAFGCIGAAVNFAVAFVVTSFTGAPPERVRNLVQDIRIPSGSPGTAPNAGSSIWISPAPAAASAPTSRATASAKAAFSARKPTPG